MTSSEALEWIRLGRKVRAKCPECGEIYKVPGEFASPAEFGDYTLNNWRYPIKDKRQQFQHNHPGIGWIWADYVFVEEKK